MSSRPRSHARAPLRHRLILSVALAAGAALTVASCTQDFSELIDGPDSGSACMPGNVSGDCNKPEGCSACSGEQCKLDCNVCGATCEPLVCTLPKCNATCAAGTTCEVTCGGGNECIVNSNGGVAHVRGAASNHAVSCNNQATCSLTPTPTQTGTTIFTCTSASNCTARTSGTQFKAACSGQSTCVVECGFLGESPSCDVECNGASVCRVKCPGGGPSCSFNCSGQPGVDCGDGWRACAKEQCPR